MTAGVLSAVALGYGVVKGVGALGDMMTPDIPKPPEPEPEVRKGDEGIRKSAMQKEGKKRVQGQLLKTQGQRASDATLGGYMQTLGG